MKASSRGDPGLTGLRDPFPSGLGGGGSVFPSIDKTGLFRRDEAARTPLFGDKGTDVPLVEEILAARSFSLIRSATVPARLSAADLGEGEAVYPSAEDIEGDLTEADDGANFALA
jgi:hypothetical protein